MSICNERAVKKSLTSSSHDACVACIAQCSDPIYEDTVNCGGGGGGAVAAAAAASAAAVEAAEAAEATFFFILNFGSIHQNATIKKRKSCQREPPPTY